jgi:hypothetical protein
MVLNNCEFCHESTDGWMNKDLILKDIKLSNGVLIMSVNVFITYKDELELYLDGPDGDILDKAVLPINYCPICGRELKDTKRITKGSTTYNIRNTMERFKEFTKGKPMGVDRIAQEYVIGINGKWTEATEAFISNEEPQNS